MPVVPELYVPPYVSQIIEETDGTYDDCTLSSAIMLAALWTGGEILFKPDGTPRDVYSMREQRVKVLGPSKKAGGTTLADASDFIRSFDDTLPDLPRYPGQARGGNLRLTFDEFWDKISDGYVAILLGNPKNIKAADSPLRSRQVNDDYGHAVMVYRGQRNRARVYDPLTRKPVDWKGEWVPKDDLREFSTAYGTPGAIGCAVVPIGAQTKEARVRRYKDRIIQKQDNEIDAAASKIILIESELVTCKQVLSSTQAELVAAQARITDLEAQLAQRPADCAEAFQQGRQSFKDQVLSIPA